MTVIQSEQADIMLDGALLATTLRCLAIQTYRVVCAIADGRAASCASRIRALSKQAVLLRRALRERGPDNVLLRWLESVQQRLEDLEHFTSDEGTKEFTSDTNRRDHPDDQLRHGPVHPVLDMGLRLRRARRRAIVRPAEPARDGLASVDWRPKGAGAALRERGESRD
jgi:hypothetical protein